MIDVKQLRIGNVVYDTKCDKVREITGIFEERLKIIIYKDVEVFGIIKDFVPIPLTEKVLEATLLHKNLMAYILGKFVISIWSNGTFWLGGSNLSVEIKTLHQLQNLYFALTQTELQIDLDKLNNAILKP